MPNNCILTSKESFVNEDELWHYGVKGMKWGVRKDRDTHSKQTEMPKRGLSDRQKNAIKIGATIAATALAAYGGYKLAESGSLTSLIKRGKDANDRLMNKIGSKRSNEYDGENLHDKIDIQFFARKASSRKTIQLNRREYAHVMSELATNITKEQKTYPTITKAIGKYVYVFENNFDDTYRVVGKKRLPDAVKNLTKGRG